MRGRTDAANEELLDAVIIGAGFCGLSFLNVATGSALTLVDATDALARFVP